MGEQQLVRREAARVALLNLWPAPEERELHATSAAILVAQPPRDVPPLGVRVRMRTMITRKIESFRYVFCSTDSLSFYT